MNTSTLVIVGVAIGGLYLLNKGGLGGTSCPGDGTKRVRADHYAADVAAAQALKARLGRDFTRDEWVTAQRTVFPALPCSDLGALYDYGVSYYKANRAIISESQQTAWLKAKGYVVG